MTTSVLLYDVFPESRQALEHRLSRFTQNIESCEDFSDLDIAEDKKTPDVIIYSAPLHYSSSQLVREISRLREHYHCPITVLTPATSSHRELGSDLIRNLQPITFIDKPPLSGDLARICLNPSSGTDIGDGERNSGDLNAKILIAEDNEFTRTLLAAIFEHSNCELVLTTNGQEAIDQCRLQKFDLILMDVHMPEVNGLEALRTIRSKTGFNRTTPTIMLTADILQQEENALFDAGASDLLFKPIDEKKLLYCVHKHVTTTLQEVAVAEVPVDRRIQQKKMFVDEVLKLTQTAKQALEKKDDILLRETTHQLLGIAGVFHMTYLERAVKALHKATQEGRGNKMFAAMETLEHEVATLAKNDGEGNGERDEAETV